MVWRAVLGSTAQRRAAAPQHESHTSPRLCKGDAHFMEACYARATGEHHLLKCMCASRKTPCVRCSDNIAAAGAVDRELGGGDI